MWVGAPERVWLYIGTYTLRSAGIESNEPADARNTYLEVLSQALSGLSQGLTERLGTQVTCENGKETAAPPEDAPSFQIELKIGEAPVEPLSFRVAATFARMLEQGIAASAAPAAEPPPKPASSHELAPLAQGAAIESGARPLDLLMEVELPISVSFGRAELPLKDVLKLTTGSIVELNRPISEPVEVIVNNCVIARGEVVVIEGNYGIRIKEILSRERRLRTLQ